MPSVKYTGVIARPVEEVFAYATDPSRHHEWQESVVESELTSEPPVGMGSTGREVRTFMGKRVETTYRVIEFVPNKRFLTESTSGPIPGTIGATFEPLPDGSTVVTLEATFELKGPFRLAGPVAERLLRGQSESSFRALKALLEGHG